MSDWEALGVTRVGFLGGGRMAEALIRGVLDAKLVEHTAIIASDVASERRQALSDRYGVRTTSSNVEVVEWADLIVLAVKPQDAIKVLQEVGPRFSSAQILLSIAAGVRLATLEAHVDPKVPVVRVMPNTPCLVGAGAAGIALGRAAGERAERVALALFGAVGRAVRVSEPLLDAVTGLSGSGPAYVFVTIEALADGGVSAGLSRDVALLLAAQTVLGAAKMVLETGQHPGVLKDQVMSPAGTTAAGLGVLEAQAVRAAFREAVVRAAARAEELGRPSGEG